MSQDYNGWTNYATWRINLEIFDGMEFDEIVDAEFLKDYADEIVIGNNKGLAYDYANAFMNNVNWHEIADHLNEDFQECSNCGESFKGEPDTWCPECQGNYENDPVDDDDSDLIHEAYDQLTDDRLTD